MTHKASSQRFPLEGFSKGQWSAHHTVSRSTPPPTIKCSEDHLTQYLPPYPPTRHLELKPRQYNQSESLIMSKTALIGI